MDRRRFLAWLGGTAAGVALAPTFDVERLLWVPGARTIFIPSARVFVTREWIDRETLRIQKQQLVFTPPTRKFDDMLRLGDTVTVRLPIAFAWPVALHGGH